MKSIRLTLVGPYPPPFGGIASHLASLIPGLRTRGAEDIAVVSFGAADATQEIGGGLIYRRNVAKHVSRMLISNPFGIAAAALRIRPWHLSARRLLVESVRAQIINDVVTRHDSNVVSFYQSDDSIALAALRPVWRKRRGIMLTVFGEVLDNAEFLFRRREALSSLLSSADALLSSSRHCARSFAQLGLPHAIEPLYYGVELDRFTGQTGDELRRRHGIPADAIVALFMGRFTPEMGIGSVLDTVRSLFERVPKLFFLLAGAPGPFSARAKELASSSAGRIVVLENVPFQDQPAIYAAADIVLAPTRDQHACMGMSIKEAMAAGRATVGSNSGGIPEAIVDGVTGILVPLGPDGGVEEGHFVNAIATLATDRSRREAMGRAARARAEEIFSAERTIDRVFEVMQSIASDTVASSS